MTFAATTTVRPERTRNEIEHLLASAGATGFGYVTQGDRSQIAFVIGARHYRFEIPLPDLDDRAFTHTPTGQRRTALQAEKAHRQAVWARWRAVLLIIKAKLEAVEAGVVTAEDEFLAWACLPGGATVRDHVHPVIDHAITTGQVGTLLALGSGDLR
jgi:hypothetical protein